MTQKHFRIGVFLSLLLHGVILFGALLFSPRQTLKPYTQELEFTIIYRQSSQPQNSHEVPTSSDTEQPPKLSTVAHKQQRPKVSARTAQTTKKSNSAGGKTSNVRTKRKTQLLRLVSRSPQPQYPAMARLLRKEGEVTFSYSVTANGQIRNVQLINYSGHASFIKAAEDALLQQRFAPPGRKVDKVLKTFAFRL